MASKSLIINAVGNVGSNVGKKYQKSFTNVNPDVSNEVAGEFARRANALTTNVFGNAQVVKKMDVTEEEQSGPVTLTVDNSNLKSSDPAMYTSTYSTIEGGVRIIVYQNAASVTEGDPVELGYVDVTY